MSLRKQIKDYAFNIYQELIYNYSNSLNNKKVHSNLDKQINNNYDNKTEEIQLNLFESNLNNTFPKLKKLKYTSRETKHHKPSFLKNIKRKTNVTTNPNIIYYNDNKLIVLKRIFKKAVNYNIITIDKSRLNLDDIK